MTVDRTPALDGIRALCVGGVFLSGYHWTLPSGWIGVLVFYVLSGFLITRILLKNREERRASTYFGGFYVRRILRIFPLYFFYLFLVGITHAMLAVPEGWERVRVIAVLYLVNFGMISGDVSSNDAWGHLWTLSVEEQFYLLWPLVVWVLSRAVLLRVAIVLVLIGPLVRFASAELFDWSSGQVYVSSLSHVDAFAAGAVLACGDFSRVKKVWPIALGLALLLFAIGMAIVFSTGVAIRTFGYPEGLKLGYGYIWAYTPLNILAALLILAGLRGELKWIGTPVLAYLGQISYCIYLVQRPIKGIYLELIEPRLLSAIGSQKLVWVIGAILCVGLSIAVSAVSYRFFEMPILRWRDRRVPG